MYHELSDTLDNKFWVTADEFRNQMQLLKMAGYESIDLRKMDQLGEGKHVLITFDDGHRSNMVAAKILKELGMVGVFYLVKDFSINDTRFLTEDEIREIAAMGHVIGVHGKNHLWWTKKSNDTLVVEFNETIEWIKELTGQVVITCSAPGGVIHRREYRILNEAFPQIKYIRSSFHDYNNEKAIELNAIGIGHGVSNDTFQQIITCDEAYYSKTRTKSRIKNFIKNIIFCFYTAKDAYIESMEENGRM